MLDLGWPEILVIAVVLILVVGPKDLPDMLRTFGRSTKKLRAMAGDFRKQFDEALKEAELGDVSDMINDARKMNPRSMLKDVIDPIESAGRNIKAGLDDAMKSAGPSPSKPAQPDKAVEGKVEEPQKIAAAPVKPATAKKTGAKPKKASTSSKSGTTRSKTKSGTAVRKSTTAAKSAVANKQTGKPAPSKTRTASSKSTKASGTKKPAGKKPADKSGDTG